MARQRRDLAQRGRVGELHRLAGELQARVEMRRVQMRGVMAQQRRREDRRLARRTREPQRLRAHLDPADVVGQRLGEPAEQARADARIAGACAPQRALEQLDPRRVPAPGRVEAAAGAERGAHERRRVPASRRDLSGGVERRAGGGLAALPADAAEREPDLRAHGVVGVGHQVERLQRALEVRGGVLVGVRACGLRSPASTA